MTLEDFLTLPLHKRIEWLRRREGSHDKLAAKLGTARQTVIGWEKQGIQPNSHYRAQLSKVSGFPADAFRRSAAEAEVWALSESRLRGLEDEVRDLRQQVDLLAASVLGSAEPLPKQPPRTGEDGPPSQASEV